MGNRKVLFMMVTSLCAAAILSGCQLAVEDVAAEGKAEQDRLIGTLITTEYLDLFDMEAYLNDNINKLDNGSLEMGENSAYEGRLYAVLETEDEMGENGETYARSEYVFHDVKGFAYYTADFRDEETKTSYAGTSSAEEISDGNIALSYGDVENIMSIEETIYVDSKKEEIVFYSNPIYQSADGSVYAVSGTGISIDGNCIGGVASTSLDETTTITEDGKTKTQTTNIKISMEVIHLPEQINIFQMDENHSTVSETSYKPGELPESMEMESQTAYVIVESIKEAADGKESVTRQIYDKAASEYDTNSLETFRSRDDGICIKQYTRLIWK